MTWEKSKRHSGQNIIKIRIQIQVQITCGIIITQLLFYNSCYNAKFIWHTNCNNYYREEVIYICMPLLNKKERNLKLKCYILNK